MNVNKIIVMEYKIGEYGWERLANLRGKLETREREREIERGGLHFADSVSRPTETQKWFKAQHTISLSPINLCFLYQSCRPRPPNLAVQYERLIRGDKYAYHFLSYPLSLSLRHSPFFFFGKDKT